MVDDDGTPFCTWPRDGAARRRAPAVPFPVSAPYAPRPGLARLADAVGDDGPGVLDTDRDLPDALRAKLARLRVAPGRCVALAPALVASPEAVARRVRAAMAAIVDAGRASRPSPDDPPALVREGGAFVATAAGWSVPAAAGAPFEPTALRDDARPVLDWIASRPPAERPLHALALAIQEDVAWIESPVAGAPAVASLLHVCFPSGWDPADKVGRDFAAIHAPVADGEALRAASGALSRALLSSGPFVRHVWTLAAHGGRARHPLDPEPPGDPASPWFRCERQVSLPLGAIEGGGEGGAALFLIRLHVAPLAEVARDDARRATLRAALASMSDATVAYKRLGALRAGLLGAGD